MNTDDEGQLRARLGAALAQLDPAPLPLEAVVRHGRAVKLRRRLLAAAAAAVVAAAALAVPALARYVGQPPSGAAGRYHVTVHPGNGSNQRVIAYGRVTTGLNDMQWSVRGAGSGRGFHLHWRAGQWHHYDHGHLASVAAGSWDDANLSTALPASPASIFDVASGDPELLAFAVRADVRYLVAVLSNGQAVTLRPVKVRGPARPRLTAIAVPAQTSITQIRAYSARGELGYTVPYAALPPRPSRLNPDASGDFQIVRWLQPGQPARPAPATYMIGRGTARGAAWSEQLKVGPWGTCVVPPTGPAGICYPAARRALLGGKAAMVLARTRYSQAHLGWDAIAAAPSVTSIKARMPDGQTVRVRIYPHDGVNYATITWSGPNPPARWIAYSASGHALASGPF
jgi:hypothetical protein